MRRSAAAKRCSTSIARAMTLAAVLAASLAVPAGAGANTFTVTTTDDEVGGSTCPAGDPDCSLREAVQRANATFQEDTIIVPAGTYDLTRAGAGEDQADSGDIDIENGPLAIVGAGAATTTLDANDLDRVFHVVDSASASISGLTIRDGNAGTGAGIFNDDDSSTVAPTTTAVSECTLVSNTGTAVHNEGAGAVTIANSTITGNDASSDGGGISNQNEATMNVSETTITGNTTSQRGGGVFNQNQAQLTIETSAITGNTATGIGGGGIYAQNQATTTVSGSTISGNTATGEGDGGALNIQNQAVFAATNTTISGNAAANRGGVAYAQNQPTIRLANSTAARNSAGAAGGGFFDNTSPPDPTPPFFIFASTIVAENTVAGTTQNCVSNHPGVFASQGHNLEDANSCEFGAPGDIPNANPALGPLADNGGPTQTHALEAGSAAIDAGPSDCPPPGTDQRGVERPQGPACDIGAFEVEVEGQPTPQPATPPAAGPCANVIPGSKKSDKLTGTDGSDLIRGRRGNDRIRGRGGDDCLRGGRGRDRISGGKGDDRIHVRRGRGDVVRCGPGKDTVIAGKKDRVRRGCEKVKT